MTIDEKGLPDVVKRTMKFGVSLSGLQRSVPDADMTGRMAELIHYVNTARDLGFDYVSVGQHYLSAPFQFMQPIPLLARLVSESGDMGLVSTVVAPLHNPLAIAEAFTALDILSGGRVTLALALGYREEEYAAFGVTTKTRVGRLVEFVECLRGLWSEGEWTNHGKYFDFNQVTLSLRPVQLPHPPLWIAANADRAVTRAAAWGLPWRINSHATLATIARQIDMYRAAYQPQESANDVVLPMGREMFCARTREEAADAAVPFLHKNYLRYADWGQDKALPGNEDFRIPYEALSDDRFVVGDPTDCYNELCRYAELGVGFTTLRMTWPGMPDEVALSSMKLFASEVIPEFR